MIGKIRGFFILFLTFTTLAAVCAILAFVDIERTWLSVRPWLYENVPYLGPGDGSELLASLDNGVDQARFVTDAAFQALKTGKANPGEVYEIGQLYMKANREGQLDEAEFDRFVNLADKTGVMDMLIDKALTSTESYDADNENASHSQYARNANPDSQLQELMTAFDRARADGQLGAEEIMTIVQQAKDSGLQARITGMLPAGYDQTQARTAARNLVKAIVLGKTSTGEASSIVEMFTQAQADGRLEKSELDRITRAAESLAR